MLSKPLTNSILLWISWVICFLSLEGGELFQHLANAKKFSEKQAKFYVMQVALALGHLHDKDFIYRDLKLENILMD